MGCTLQSHQGRKSHGWGFSALRRVARECARAEDPRASTGTAQHPPASKRAGARAVSGSGFSLLMGGPLLYL